MAKNRRGVPELRDDILDEIVDDDKHAGQTIQQLRALLLPVIAREKGNDVSTAHGVHCG
jgi:hypothetical protein